uniref:Cyclic nucleotide-binding domain-containing protein n=1 Tax=Macrostomum lignano TaxID=282301 RepID=A0A1I8F5L4_9PLAT
SRWSCVDLILAQKIVSNCSAPLVEVMEPSAGGWRRLPNSITMAAATVGEMSSRSPEAVEFQLRSQSGEFGASGTAGMLWSDEASESTLLALATTVSCCCQLEQAHQLHSSVIWRRRRFGGAASSATGAWRPTFMPLLVQRHSSLEIIADSPAQARLASRAAKKLSQRQRSYRQSAKAHGALSPVDTARLRALLDLQYTSSDDELHGCGGVNGCPGSQPRQQVERPCSIGTLPKSSANPRERRELERVRSTPGLD